MRKIRIKGNENFYPFKPDGIYFDFDISPLFQFVNRKPMVCEKTSVEIAAGCDIDVPSGIYPVRFGTCLGEIEVINKN